MCPNQTQSFYYKKNSFRLKLVTNVSVFFSVRERPEVTHQCVLKIQLVFLLEKNLLICILVNALPHVFAENSNTTGLTGKEKLSRHKTNLVS